MNKSKLVYNTFKFKPEFGNLEHIRICEEIAKYNKMRSEYQAYLDKRAESLPLRKKCIESKKKIRRMIEYVDNKAL